MPKNMINATRVGRRDNGVCDKFFGVEIKGRHNGIV